MVEVPWCADNIAFFIAFDANVWAEGSGFELGIPEVRASIPLFRHGTVLQSGSRSFSWYIRCSLIFHRSFCS